MVVQYTDRPRRTVPEIGLLGVSSGYTSRYPVYKGDADDREPQFLGSTAS